VQRRHFGPATLVIAVALEIWLLSGVTGGDILRFAGYEVAFVALPGVAMLWALRGRWRGFLEAIALGIPLGHALEILAFSATAAAGVRGLYVIYPVVVVVPSLLVIRKRRNPAVGGAPEPPMSSRIMWGAALTLSAGLIYQALMFIPQAPLPSSQVSVSYSPDFVYQISKTAEVLYHWPPTNPGLSGVPLPYEWFVFFHMAAVSQVTHLALATIALRLDFLPFLIVIGCELLVVGRALSRKVSTGVVAMAVVFLLGPLDLTTDVGGTPFFSSLSNVLWSSWTFLFGLMFFIPLLYLIFERLRGATRRDRFDIGSWLLIAILLVGASGAKATVLPVLLAGSALYAVLTCITRRAAPPPELLLALGLEAVIFLVTFFIIYRGGAAATVVSPLAPLGRTLPVVDASQSKLTGFVLAVALPSAYVAGLLGMLLPLAGLLYMLRSQHRARLRGYGLCLCLLGAGVVIANVFHQIGYSELYFQDTGYVAGCIVAADALRLAWVDLGTVIPISRRAATTALGAWIVVLAAVVIATSPTRHPLQTAVVRYIALGGGCILFVATWYLVMRVRHRRRSGFLVLGLIPLLAAAALASPVVLAPTTGPLLTGAAIAHPQSGHDRVRGLTPDLLAALEWLKAHSTVNDVIAVSNHWLDTAAQDGRYYYYSAFSERQVFIEGYDPARYEITTDIQTLAGADFAARQALNDEVFGSADPDALRVMTTQYSVRFLLVDSTDGDGDDDNPAVLQLGTVVFENSAATIVAVG
jgi:hypothetical protein